MLALALLQGSSRSLLSGYQVNLLVNFYLALVRQGSGRFCLHTMLTLPTLHPYFLSFEKEREGERKLTLFSGFAVALWSVLRIKGKLPDA